MTLVELVEEYLATHQAESVTVAKLRWLLGQATETLGEKRLVLSERQTAQSTVAFSQRLGGSEMPIDRRSSVADGLDAACSR